MFLTAGGMAIIHQNFLAVALWRPAGTMMKCVDEGGVRAVAKHRCNFTDGGIRSTQDDFGIADFHV